MTSNQIDQEAPALLSKRHRATTVVDYLKGNTIISFAIDI